MGTTDRKKRQKIENKAAILSAALHLFTEEGYENVTIRKIADKVDYGAGTIYLYFKDRDEIFFELHKKGFEEFFKRLSAIQDIIDPIKKISEHALTYIQFAIDQPQYYDLMFISHIPAKYFKLNREWEYGDKAFNILKENIKQAKENGSFKEVDAEVAAFSIWSFLHGIASLFVRDRLTSLPEENLKYLIPGALKFIEKLL